MRVARLAMAAVGAFGLVAAGSPVMVTAGSPAAIPARPGPRDQTPRPVRPPWPG